MTKTLANNTEYTIKTNRDRIYFYLDENLSTKDRTATVNISYTDDKTQTPRIRTIEIVQHGLLPVTVPGDDDNPTQQIYVEAYEEYISHYDPLNEFEGNYIYDGLEWGLNGEYLGWNLVIQGEDETWCNIYYNGAEATQHIISKAGQSTMNLNEKPRSAAEYCYNKNKRNDNGVVQGMTNSSGWFLPGIRQLEAILTSYYNTYPEFQNNFIGHRRRGKDGLVFGHMITMRTTVMPVPPRPCQTVVMQKVTGTIRTRVRTAPPAKPPVPAPTSASVRPMYRPAALPSNDNRRL